MIRKIYAKSLLSTVANGPDAMFGLTYNMNLYRGCQHGCIYCDSRSACYRIENFDDILIKENAPELLARELGAKKKKGTIGTGSMNDPYMPLEKEAGRTRQALQIIGQHQFPVHVLTKSDLVRRDIDLLQEIGRIYAAVSLTITTADDDLAQRLEPGAPPSSVRFATLRELTARGIYAGIILTPVLPFITDPPGNIAAIVQRGKQAGARYILFWPGMTLRDGQREYYYQRLDRLFPGLTEQYRRRYRNDYSCDAPGHEMLTETFQQTCRQEAIATKMAFYRRPAAEQTPLFPN